jgi:hypothetical protein
MHGPSTPPQNLRHERKRKPLKRASIKMGDIIYFTHKNGKSGSGEIVSKYNKNWHPFGPSQHWKVLNSNSYRHVVVPENKINSVVMNSTLWNWNN